MAYARFGLPAMLPASWLARHFSHAARAALFAGIAAHSVLPLEFMTTSAIGLVLAMAGHADGWPIARGGSQAIAHALATYFQSLGRANWRVVAY